MRTQSSFIAASLCTQRALLLQLALVSLLAGYAADARGQPVIVVSADTEGHVHPCRECPEHQGSGGLARRATLVATIRADHPEALLLDAGNFAFGTESMSSNGQVIIDAYDALKYSAVNVSYREFRQGSERTIALLKTAGFAAVSANLCDEATGTLLFPPYVVKSSNGKRVAILGVTALPEGIAQLPHIRQQLRGIKIEAPATALTTWLPKARAEADSIVVLFYGSGTDAELLRERFGKDVSAIVVGGVRPAKLAAHHKSPPLIATAEHGKSLVQLTLGGEARQLRIEPKLPEDDAMRKVVARSAQSEVQFKQTITGPATAPSTAVPPLPPAMDPERIYRLDLTAQNRGARLTVMNATSVGSYAGVTAAAGRKLLVLSTEWENIIPLTLIEDRQVPTTYKVSNLADHLYLVVDGSRLAQLHPDAKGMAGHVPVTDFSIPQIGSRLRGNVVFEIPAGARSLNLRFYDFAHGHIMLDLSGTALQATPKLPSQKNEAVEVAVFDVRGADTLRGIGAPAGLRYVIVDWRARSVIETSADAAAFDPQAKAGAKVSVGTVADWKESRKYLQMIVDGEQAWPATDRSDLPPEPRFLPDRFTGGDVVFLVPEKCKSLELRCDFPNARLTSGQVIRPAGLVIPLEGSRPAPMSRERIAGVKDDFFDVLIVAQSVTESLDGIRAAAGHRFLVLDVVVRNLAKQQEFFQTVEQLKHVDEKGVAAKADGATFGGLGRPMAVLYIPAAEQRYFQLAYLIAASETKPRLAYASATKGGAKVLDLPAIVAGLPATNIAAQPGATQPVAQRPAIDTDLRAAPVTAKQNRTPRGLEGIGLTTDEVNRSITRGSQALWELIRDDDLNGKTAKFGSSPEQMLSALALVHAGAHKTIPEFDAVLRQFLTEVKPRKLRTYEAGVVAMLVEAYGDGEFGGKMEEAARHLLETQASQGTWTYVTFLADALYVKADAPIATQPGGPDSPSGEASVQLVRRSPQQSANATADNSNTQYAILGLNAASRTGIKVAPEVWQSTLRTTLERQENSGGWAYQQKGQAAAYGSMTAAGISAIALCRHELQIPEPGKDEAIEAGLGWLVRNFSVSQHPKSVSWQYYYLYSIERVGRILDTEFIGPYEWYPLGAAHLIGQQKPSGLWIGQGYEINPRLSTSFALLFLTRATPSLNLKQKLRPASEPIVVQAPPATKPAVVVVPPPATKPAVVVVPPVVAPVKPSLPGTLQMAAVAPFHHFYIILDASGSMLAEMNGKTKFDIARESVRALLTDLPPDCHVALRVYGHRRRATEVDADQDSELIIPMAPLDRRAFGAVLDALRPRGKTPLALSIEAAATDLGGKEDQKQQMNVLLLTDGGEDTAHPRRDPRKSAELLTKRPGVRFHVVGFDIQQPEWTEQLRGIAQSGGGQYWPAAGAADLERDLRINVLGLPENYVVLDGAGREVARAKFGNPATLPEGVYRLQTVYGGKAVEREFTIAGGSATALMFDLKGGGAEAGGKVNAATSPAPPAGKPAERFCTKCGAPQGAGAKFCPKCGAKLPGP